MKTSVIRILPILALTSALSSGCGKLATFSSDSQLPCNSAVATWTAPTLNSDGSPLTDLTGYRVDYGTTSGLYPYSVNVSGAANTTATITNLENNTTYYFVIQAVNSAGAAGAFSNEATKTINCSGSSASAATIKFD